MMTVKGEGIRGMETEERKKGSSGAGRIIIKGNENEIAAGAFFFNDVRVLERKKVMPKTLVGIERERRREIYVSVITITT